jgi:type IV secretory pathway VirB6-like protein
LARAKQTNRAEARRRYRQTFVQSTDDTELDADGDAAPSARTAAATRPTPAATATAARPGLGSAFRAAYRPANYREDLAALPKLIRGRWFLIALGLVVVGFIGALFAPNALTLFAFQTLTLPPAMIPIFLVGFTAPRASYLLGLLVGIVDVALYSLYVVTIAAPASGSTIPIGDFLFSGITVGLPASVLFAAGAAWYKRFLALSSAGRAQRGSSGRSKSGSKSAAKAGGRR